MGCLYLEIEGQSCLVGSVDHGLIKNRQIDLLDRITQKEKNSLVNFSHSDVARHLSANNRKRKKANF